jgi:hypothetical protein
MNDGVDIDGKDNKIIFKRMDDSLSKTGTSPGNKRVFHNYPH